MNTAQMKALELAQRFVIRWGRFRGRRLDEIPSDYLRWLAEYCEVDIIASHADTVWNWREGVGAHIDGDA